MFRITTTVGALVAIVVLCLALALNVTVEQHRFRLQRDRALAASLTASNLAAERDSTRTVAAQNRRIAALLGDSLRLVEKQVLQIAQHRDRLDAALSAERRARYALTTSVDSLRSSASAAVRADTSRGLDARQEVRYARFDLRQKPYTIQADVAMPPAPDSAHIDLRVALDPIPLEARVVCTAPDPLGVRSASITASSPRWASVQFARVEQSPELCAPPPMATQHRHLETNRLVVGLGRSYAVGRSDWSLFVGLGVIIWG